MEDDNLENKNIFLIKFKLSSLSLRPGDSCYHIYIGNYILKIWTPPLKNFYLYDVLKDDRITNHEKIDVNLYEWNRRYYSVDGEPVRYEEYINLEQDERFVNYKPIKYHELTGYSGGDKMPILHLCELIKYLHRLSNLTAFL